MQRFFLLIISIALCTVSSAQSSSTTRVKFDDIVREHEQEEMDHPTTKNTNEIEEGEEYQFDRWAWYWEQHTDQQGYIVPKIDAYRIWKEYEAKTWNTWAKTTAVDQSNWKPIGPFENSGLWLNYQAAGIGRVNTMAFHPSDPETFAIGTAGGGAWITHDFATTWKPLCENLMTCAISDIDFNPLNPNTIYICTGDKEVPSIHFTPQYNYGHARLGDVPYTSIGLLKSYNGGITWDTTSIVLGISEDTRLNSLLINPIDTNSITVAGTTAIAKSFDGGKNWITVTPYFLTRYSIYNIWQLVYNTNDTNIMYASVQAIDSSIGNSCMLIMRSTNGGFSWAIQKNIPNAIRAAIAVTESDPNLLKVIVADDYNSLEGIYSSNNAGGSFTKVFGGIYTTSGCSNNLLASDVQGISCHSTQGQGQGAYDLCIAIDPNNVKHIIIGGVNTWESIDSGYSWHIKTIGSADMLGVPLVHADHHFLGFHPLYPSVLFDCNDGGIYYFGPTPIGTTAWTSISNGINITQYYRNAVSDNASFVLGGAQDNGTSLIYRSTQLTTPVGPGDGADCQIDPTNPNIIYATYVMGGHLFKWDLSKGLSFSTFNDLVGNIPNTTSGNWITPFLLDPNNHNKLYTAYKTVFASPDQGVTWSPISPGFNKLIKRLALTNAAAGTIYATEETGNNINITYDSGASWTTIAHPYSEPLMSDIVVDHKNKKQCWITFPGFGTNKTKVAMYNDGVWKTMNENLPDLPVYCITQDTSNGTLYIGNYTGVYYRTATMTQWEKFSNNHPIVNVFDLGINYKTGEIVAATWGRGMWASPKYEENLKVPNGIPYAYNTITLYPNPSSGNFIVTDNNDYFKNKTVTLQLIDVTGKTVWQSHQVFSNVSLPVSITGVTSGSYVLDITANDGISSRKRIIIK
ncbi:MAG: T9SS type A sorting domain-containing protein [Bacteroidetes bacterium]|nr:T9SS type A sorting domain-containing protein [Bacteroidota bacterium]